MTTLLDMFHEQSAIEEKARKFANGKIGSGRLFVGEDFAKAISNPARFFPKVAGRFVCNQDDPENGFATREEAREAARIYRESCRAYLASRSSSAPHHITIAPEERG